MLYAYESVVLDTKQMASVKHTTTFCKVYGMIPIKVYSRNNIKTHLLPL
jgi:hypothetical protein